MRVLLITDRLTRRGGAGAHLLDLAAELRRRGHDIRWAVGSSGPDCDPGPHSVRVRALGRSIPDRRQLGLLQPALAWADLAHIQNITNPIALRAALAGPPAVVTVQDHRFVCPGPGRTLPSGEPCSRPMDDSICTGCLPDSGYRARLLGLTADRRDALAGATIIVLSDYMATELALAGLPGAHVVPPWIVGPRPDPMAGDGFVVAGRLVAHKGISLAVDAWRIANIDAPLWVAGAGSAADQLPPSATQLGWLDRPALLALLASSRGLLFTSRWQEPFGIVAVEALSQGTPVIRVPTGGTDAWAGAGVRTVAGTPDAIAAAIVDWQGDPNAALRMGRAGQAAVWERYDREPLADRIEAIYASAIEAG